MYSKFPLAILEPFSRIVRPYNNAGSFNATVFISMLSGGRAGVSINSPAAANTSLLVSIVWRADNNSARERRTCSGVWRSVTISIEIIVFRNK